MAESKECVQYCCVLTCQELKKTMLLIGKSETPGCLKGFKTIPVNYQNNNKHHGRTSIIEITCILASINGTLGK